MIKHKPLPVLVMISMFSLVCLWAAFRPSGGGADLIKPYKGDIVYTEPLKAVVFSHEAHVVKNGIGCGACHSGLFAPAANSAQEKGDFTMASFSRGEYCGACHNGRTAFSSNSECARCHVGVKGAGAYAKTAAVEGVTLSPPAGKLELGSGDSAVEFSHEVHAGIFNCARCHSGMFPMSAGKTEITMDAINRGRSCGSCHDGKTAFSAGQCSRCHAKVPAPTTDLVYAARGMKSVRFSHAFHTRMFKCGQCHTKRFKMQEGASGMNMNAMYSGRFCGSCHDGKAAFAVMDCGKCHRK